MSLKSHKMLIERPSRLFRLLFPGAIFRLPAPEGEKPRVYLTFDDGPIPEATPWVLDILDKYGVKATFFMVGQNVERHPELLEEVKRRGHAVGNHTLHHMQGMKVSFATYMRDSLEGARLTGSVLFRPPHGMLCRKQLNALKKHWKVIMYDLVTRDYSNRLTANEVFGNVKRYARNGSIIVFHDALKSLPRLKESLPQSIEWLKCQGYEFHLLTNDN